MVNLSLPFHAKDGVENVITLALADNPSSDYLILLVPAMGVAAAKYTGLLESFASNGVSAACFDLRGIGNSSVRASRKVDFGYSAMVEYDIPAAIDELKKRQAKSKIVLMGHSLGGQTSTLYLAQNKASCQIEHLVLAASCSVYYKNWGGTYSWGLLCFAQMSSLIAKLVGYFPGKRLGFGGREARGVMLDWAYNARNGGYRLHDKQYDFAESFGLSKLNVLAINFTEDNFAPITATEHLLTKISSAKVHKHTLTGADIGQSTADHFNWLKSPKNVAELVCNWLPK